MNLINYFYHYKDSRVKINTKHEYLVNLFFNRSQKPFMYKFRLFTGKKSLLQVVKLIKSFLLVIRMIMVSNLMHVC